MAFLTEDDYKMLISEEDLEIVQSADEDIRLQAENTAQGQISNALRNRYDVDAVFEAEGDDRDSVIMMYMIDMVLYHLWTSIPGRGVPESRQVRYDDALQWMKDVNAGKMELDLPLKDEDDSGISIRFGYEEKKTWGW